MFASGRDPEACIPLKTDHSNGLGGQSSARPISNPGLRQPGRRSVGPVVGEEPALADSRKTPSLANRLTKPETAPAFPPGHEPLACHRDL